MIHEPSSAAPTKEAKTSSAEICNSECSMCKGMGSIASGFAVRPCPKCNDGANPTAVFTE
jgi:hypothetical protein